MQGYFTSILFSLTVIGILRPAIAVAGADPWLIKDFDVTRIGNFTSNITVRLKTADPEMRYYWYVDYPVDFFNLEDFGSVSSDVSDKASMEDHLNFSADFMERYGFPSPLLERVVQRPDGTDAYRIYLMDDLVVAVDIVGRVVGGVYDKAACWGDGTGLRAIVLNSAIIYSGKQVNNFGLEALSHELFHSVQFNTHLFREYCSKIPTRWITEGTAQEIGLAIADLVAGGLDGKPAIERYGVRDYTVPLHRPDASEVYQTSSFWRFLAEYHAFVVNDRPTPSAAPGAVNYGYMVSIFEQPSASLSDDFTNRPESELELVDGWLQRAYGGKGLRNLFTHFGAVLPYYPAYRRFSGISKDSWLDATMSGCPVIKLKSTPLDLTSEQFISMNPVSAACWRIQLEGFDADSVPVIAEVFADDEVQLGQLAAGSSMSPDQADQIDLKENRPVAAPRVRLQTKIKIEEYSAEGGYVTNFLFPFEPDREGSFVLTNVAKKAVDTVDLDLSKIVFTALYEYASMGAPNLDGGAIADAINTPLEIEFDNYRAVAQVGQAEKVGEQYVGKVHSEGLTNPCFLQITAYGDFAPGRHFAQSFGISLLKSGAITKGEYPVAPYKEFSGDYAEMFPGGEAVAGALLYDMPENQNDLQWESGTLTIDAINRHLVVGHVNGVAHHREYSTTTGKKEIVETRTLAAKFSVRLRGVLGRYRDMGYPCIGRAKAD